MTSMRRLVVVLLVLTTSCSSAPSTVQTADQATTSAPSSIAATSTTASVVAGAPIEPEPRRPVPYRLLAEALPIGDPYTTAVISDAATYVAIAAGAGLDPADVDFDTEVVFVFNLAESSTPACAFLPVMDLLFDETEQHLYPLALRIDPKSMCVSIWSPYQIIFGVSRDVLPQGDFSIGVDEREPGGCCDDGVTFVAAGELS